MSTRKIEFNDANFDTETSAGLSVICFEEPSDAWFKKQVKVIETAASEISGDITVGKCDIERCSNVLTTR